MVKPKMDQVFGSDNYRGDKAAREFGLTVRLLDETMRDAIAWFQEERVILPVNLNEFRQCFLYLRRLA